MEWSRKPSAVQIWRVSGNISERYKKFLVFMMVSFRKLLNVLKTCRKLQEILVKVSRSFRFFFNFSETYRNIFGDITGDILKNSRFSVSFKVSVSAENFKTVPETSRNILKSFWFSKIFLNFGLIPETFRYIVKSFLKFLKIL